MHRTGEGLRHGLRLLLLLLPRADSAVLSQGKHYRNTTQAEMLSSVRDASR